MIRQKKNKGMAIVIVLILSMAFLVFAAMVVQYSRNQKFDHGKAYERMQAMMAARGVLQLAIYKFRVLPSEFYKVHQGNLMASTSPPAVAAAYNQNNDTWMSDFDTSLPDSPAARLSQELNSMFPDDKSYDCGIDEFKLISKKSRGYDEDYVKIKAWGTYGTEKRILEELIKVEIAEDL